MHIYFRWSIYSDLFVLTQNTRWNGENVPCLAHLFSAFCLFWLLWRNNWGHDYWLTLIEQCSAVHDKNKVHLDEMWWCILDPDVAPLRHIIMSPSQPDFALTACWGGNQHILIFIAFVWSLRVWSTRPTPIEPITFVINTKWRLMNHLSE